MRIFDRWNSSGFYLPAAIAMILLLNLLSLSLLSGCDDKKTKRGESEPNNSFETCNLVSPNITVNAVVDPSGDDDYFCFDVEAAGTVVTAEVTGTTLLSPFVELYGPGPDHELLATGTDFLDGTVEAPLGRHFVVVGDTGGDGGPDYTYTLTITSTGPAPTPTPAPTTPPPTATPTSTPAPTAAPTAPPTPSPSPTPSPTPAPVMHTVSMVDNVFIPKEITIKVGDTIKWTNDGTLAHDVRSDDGTTFSSESEFPGPTYIKPGDEFEFTFTAEGIIPYYCILHAIPGGTTGMVGTVTVVP